MTKERKCMKCGLTTPYYTKLESGAYICNGCNTKEFLEYINGYESWAEESEIALRFISELEEGIYQRDQYIKSLEKQLAEPINEKTI